MTKRENKIGRRTFTMDFKDAETKNSDVTLTRHESKNNEDQKYLCDGG